jgi:succinoglycan biosynthesis protein ExoA
MKQIKKLIFNLEPMVSIIMAIRNEAEFIEACLNAIVNQDYPKKCLEIIIADGMSEDATRKIIHQIQNKFSKDRILLLDNPSLIVATGLNKAIRYSKGRIIIRIDGHTFAEPDYIRQCISALYHSGADNVGGRMNAIGRNFFGKTVASATSSVFGVGDAKFHYLNHTEWVDTVYMGAWPRQVFERIGLFDEELKRNQDDELNYRLRASGGRILISPKIQSNYYNRNTLSSLWRQYFQYGFWKIRVLQKHPKQMQVRQFIPPLFVFSLVVSILFIPIFSNGWFIFALVVVSYFFATVSASLFIAIKNGIQYFPLLPVAFVTLHISYGLGFLIGLVKFAGRWRDKEGKVPKLLKLKS